MSALSDNLVTFAILAYLIAMIGHAVEYALGNARTRVASAAPVRELVGAGGGVIKEPPAPVPAPPVDRSTRRARLAGLFGVGATAVAALLHLAALVTRGLAADRMPWGNMYEFVLTVTFIGVAAWLVVLWKRPSLRKLGLFLTLVMVLLVATAELVLYVPIVPLVPALNSYWFVIHVSTIVFASGIFLLGAVPRSAS